MNASAVAPRIAVVGVSTLVGEAVIQELRARKIACAELHALDDERNVGRPVTDVEAADGDGKLAVEDVAQFDFSRVDLAFFCGRSALAERYAEAAAAHAWVIDSSATFRARADVPLVTADVNSATLAASGVPGPHCSAGQRQRGACHGARRRCNALAGLARVEVATYQAVSGSGRRRDG